MSRQAPGAGVRGFSGPRGCAGGDHLMVRLNGETTVDARSDRHTHGPIALQYNASGQVRFRNVKVKTLD